MMASIVWSQDREDWYERQVQHTLPCIQISLARYRLLVVPDIIGYDHKTTKSLKSGIELSVLLLRLDIALSADTIRILVSSLLLQPSNGGIIIAKAEVSLLVVLLLRCLWFLCWSGKIYILLSCSGTTTAAWFLRFKWLLDLVLSRLLFLRQRNILTTKHNVGLVIFLRLSVWGLCIWSLHPWHLIKVMVRNL